MDGSRALDSFRLSRPIKFESRKPPKNKTNLDPRTATPLGNLITFSLFFFKTNQNLKEKFLPVPTASHRTRLLTSVHHVNSINGRCSILFRRWGFHRVQPPVVDLIRFNWHEDTQVPPVGLGETERSEKLKNWSEAKGVDDVRRYDHAHHDNGPGRETRSAAPAPAAHIAGVGVSESRSSSSSSSSVSASGAAANKMIYADINITEFLSLFSFITLLHSTRYGQQRVNVSSSRYLSPKYQT